SKAPQRMLGILVGNLIVLLNVRQLVISLEANPTVTYVAFSVVVALFAFSLTAGFKHLKTDRKEH
nr:hypothetical protein [Rhodoluna sp.]